MFQPSVEKPAVFFLRGQEWLSIQVAGSNYEIMYLLITAICCAVSLFPLFLYLEMKKTEISQWMINTAGVQQELTAGEKIT